MMYTHAEKAKAPQQSTFFAKSQKPSRPFFSQSHEVNPFFDLQRTIGNQGVQRLLQSNVEEHHALIANRASPHVGHDFSRIPIRRLIAGTIQTKLAINLPGDEYEQEADRVSKKVMRMDASGITNNAPPAIQLFGTGINDRLGEKLLQRFCTRRKEEAIPRSGMLAAKRQVLRQTEATVNAISGGRPLANEQRAFFEPRFGVDFSRVRVHTDGSADNAARAVGALAFTRGCDIVFRKDQYQPNTKRGQTLIAHELMHVIQQQNQMNTVMRACNCETVPDAAIPSTGWEQWMACEFPNMIPGDWCHLHIANGLNIYNCFGWVLGELRNIDADEIVSTIQDSLRDLGRDEEASRLDPADVTVSHMDLFFWQKRRLQSCPSPTNAQIALFARGENSPTHAALAAPTPCGNATFTSKLGPRGPLVIHDLFQLVGSQYGDIVRYYC